MKNVNMIEIVFQMRTLKDRINVIKKSFPNFWRKSFPTFSSSTNRSQTTTKIKTKTFKQLKVLMDNEFIDNKLFYYLKPTDSPAPRFYGQPKIHKPRVPIRPIISFSGSVLLR